MILEKQTEAHILEEGTTQETVKMSLDLDSAQILMQMLSKNLYSDAIGSTIRECASNALDSHRRAGCDKPIIVSFRKNEHTDTIEFAVEDFGIGLDADDVKNIISKYGKSTKRNSNTELGMMGLGFKAPLAYSSSFYFIARKDGMERKYMMYEGEDTNSIDLLYEVESNEANGVKVIVPVNYSDRRSYADKIAQQLAYFENVYFDIDSSLTYSNITNDFTIHRAEDYQFSSLASSHSLHLCLDNVTYPIDWEKIGISSIDFPVALRFSLSDGIFPTPNRESIRYTQEAKQIILDKITKLANVFMTKYNETITGEGNPISIIEFYSNNERYITNIFKDNSGMLKIDNLLKYATIPISTPKMDGVDTLDWKRMSGVLKEYFLGEYHLKFRYDRGKFKDATKHYYKSLTYEDIKPRWGKPAKIYTYADRLPKSKQDYLRTILGDDQCIFVKKHPFKLKAKHGTDYQSYQDVLALYNYPKYKWRKLIQEFQTVVKFFEKDFIDSDAIQISQTWIDEQKAKRKKVLTTSVTVGGAKKVRMKGEFSGKVGESMQVTLSDQYCKFVPKTFKMEEIYSNKSLNVYAKEFDRKQMDKLWSCFRKDAKFIIVADSTYKNLLTADAHNWITMDKFIEGKNRPFRTMATTFLLEQFMSEYDSIFRRVDFINKVSTDLADKISILEKYHRANDQRYADRDTKQYIIEHATDHNLFNQEIYIIYKQVKEVFEKLSFLKPMLNQFSYYINDDMIAKAVADLFKYHKHRVNLKHYAIILNEDKPLKEELTEDTIDQLQTI